jgi:outer membrane lipoprotein SlyB
MKWGRNVVLFIAVAALSACATMPTGPSVMVLPPPGKPFEVFQSEDQQCRSWAQLQTGKNPSEVANQNLASGAAIGTLMGAALGAAIGSASGNAGAGAGIGAASGLVGGTAVASGPAYAAGSEVQRRYDIAYEQCMYAKGNIIPGVVSTPQASAAPPPPPPPGYKPEPSPAPPAGASAPPPSPYPQQ